MLHPTKTPGNGATLSYQRIEQRTGEIMNDEERSVLAEANRFLSQLKITEEERFEAREVATSVCNILRSIEVSRPSVMLAAIALVLNGLQDLWNE
jgi:hypothetical protein